MEVANTGFMLDRLGQDCAPLQFLRELTQNSIEAIQQVPDRQGEIVWDVDWNRYDLTGISGIVAAERRLRCGAETSRRDWVAG
jgi:hypothetical protein